MFKAGMLALLVAGMLALLVAGKPLIMELDTEASVSISTAKDLLATLAGRQALHEVGSSHAYQQALLDLDSRNYIGMHMG